MTNDGSHDPVADEWVAEVVTHPDGQVSVVFAAQPVVDTAPLRLMGSTQVWVDPFSPSAPARLDVGDITKGAEALWALLGEAGFAIVDDAARAQAAGTGTPITVAATPQWAAVCRWALVNWLRDFVPSGLDPALLDIEAAAAASSLARSHVLDAHARDELEEVWRRSARRLVTLATAIENTQVLPLGVVQALAEPLEQGARFLDGDPDPRFRQLADLDLRLRELMSSEAASGSPVGSVWRVQVDPGGYEKRVKQGLAAFLSSMQMGAREPLVGADLMGGDRGNGGVTAAAAAGIKRSDSSVLGSGSSDRRGSTGSDWLLIPPRVIDNSETAIQWEWWAEQKTVSVDVSADLQSVLDGRWCDDLAFRLVDSRTGEEVVRGSLVPDAATGRYAGAVTAESLSALPQKTDVDVFVLRGGAPAPAPLSAISRTTRRARRDMARAIVSTRLARVAHTVSGGEAQKQVADFLGSAAEQWKSARDDFFNADQMDLFALCDEQSRVSIDSLRAMTLDHVERPTVAELGLVDLLPRVMRP